MEFSSLFFLYIFLPLTLAVYFLVPSMRAKNAVLTVASLIFYATGRPLYLLVLLGSAFVNYALGKRVQPNRRGTLVLPVAVNLLLLVFFKYLNFFLGIFGIHGAEGGDVLKLALPLGISFFTFQAIAYHADIYRGKTQPAAQFSKLLLYLSMFPKMPVGPIVRYSEVEPQLMRRRTNSRAIFEGGIRFLVGLAKKVLIADYAAKVITELAPAQIGMAAWFSALMYMFQIYFDFSGCSDMAIGLGRVFGFRYCENFDLPYASRSVTEFWRRWHMSLGSFFRDYVYIPLGGNRKGKARQILNMAVVWALTGLWHGASWNYILWGLYFFVLLSVEKQLMPKLESWPFLLRNLLTMFFVLMGWVIFSHENLSELGAAFAAMFAPKQFWSGAVWVQIRNSLPLFLLCIVGSSVLPRWFSLIWSGLFAQKQECRANRAFARKITVRKVIYAVSLFAYGLLLLWLCTVSLVGSTGAPSLYAAF